MIALLTRLLRCAFHRMDMSDEDYVPTDEEDSQKKRILKKRKRLNSKVCLPCVHLTDSHILRTGKRE